MKKQSNPEPPHISKRPPPPPAPPMIDQSANDARILEAALQCMTKAFDDFIGQCQAEGGPTRQDIARARAILPPGCANSYPQKERDAVRGQQIAEQMAAGEKGKSGLL